MSRSCTVCLHPRRNEAENRLQQGFLLTIHFSQPGVQAWCRSWCCSQVPFQFRLACFQFVQALLQARCSEAVRDGLDDSCELTLHHIQFPAPGSIVSRRLCLQPVPLRGELGDECRDVLGLHQSGSEGIQDQLLQNIAPDAPPVAAHALPARGRAGKIVPADVGHRTVAAAAECLCQSAHDGLALSPSNAVGLGSRHPNWRGCFPSGTGPYPSKLVATWMSDQAKPSVAGLKKAAEHQKIVLAAQKEFAELVEGQVEVVGPHLQQLNTIYHKHHQ